MNCSEDEQQTAQEGNELVLFQDMETTCFQRWQEVELHFDLKGHRMTDKDEIRVYKYGWADIDNFLMANNVDQWIPSTSNGVYSTTFSVARLDGDSVFQAGYVSGNQVIATSCLFRTVPSDDTEELIVVRPEELEDHVYWKRAYRILESKYATLNKSLEEMRFEHDLAVKNVDTLSLSLKELDVLRSQLEEARTTLSLKEEIMTKQEQTIARYWEYYLLRDKQLTMMVKNLGRTTKSYEELRRDHENLLVDYELQQSALQNTKELLQAQEETKVLLQAELASQKGSKARAEAVARNMYSINEMLKVKLAQFCSKPLMKDALVGPADADNVINNALVSTSTTEELEAKVNELVARLNVAALEYSNLYKQNRQLERLCNQCCGIDKEKEGGSSCPRAVVESVACSTKSTAEPVSRASTSKASSSGDPTTLAEPVGMVPPNSQQPEANPKPQLLSQGCQTCLPAHICVAFQAVGSDTRPILPCRGFTAGHDVAIPVCGKSRKMGHMPTSVPPNWRKSKHQYLARERRNKTPWNIPLTSCTSGAMTTSRLKEEGKENGEPSATLVLGLSEPKVADNGFVAIEMPDLQGDSISPGDPINTKATPCSLCKAEPANLEEHLREVHMQQPCPVCSQLFDTTLPASYLQEHVEDHFLPSLPCNTPATRAP